MKVLVTQVFDSLRPHGRQPPLSMEFSRQEYWSGLPFPSLGDLPHPGIKPVSPCLAGRFFTTAPPGKPWPPCRHPLNDAQTDTQCWACGPVSPLHVILLCPNYWCVDSVILKGNQIGRGKGPCVFTNLNFLILK